MPWKLEPIGTIEIWGLPQIKMSSYQYMDPRLIFNMGMLSWKRWPLYWNGALIQGPISRTVFLSQFKFVGHFVSPSLQFWRSDCYRIFTLHDSFAVVAYEKNCCDLMVSNGITQRQKIPLNLNCVQELFSEMGPRSISFGCDIIYWCHSITNVVIRELWVRTCLMILTGEFSVKLYSSCDVSVVITFVGND